MNALIRYLIILAFLAPLCVSAQTVTVHITDIRNTDGQIQLALFINGNQFDNDAAVKYFRYSKADVENGKLTVTLDLEPGTYGLALLDDEDADKKMSYNWIGYPQEGYGFSDYYHTSWSRPSFSDFQFQFGSESKSITVKVRYM